MFSCEFRKISKKTFLTEHLRLTASDLFLLKILEKRKILQLVFNQITAKAKNIELTAFIEAFSCDFRTKSNI